MKNYKCQNCGAQLQNRADGRFYCEYCKHVYDIETADQAYDRACRHITLAAKTAVSQAFLEQELETIAKCRQNLFVARNREFISNSELKTWANEIRKHNPYDVQAKFFMLAADKRWAELNKYLRKIVAKENIHLLAGFVKYLTNGQFIEKCILTINDMISSGIGETSPAYKSLHEIISKAAKTANSGIFDENLPRDVFVAYSSKDKEKAYELVEYLEEKGLKCFISMRNLPKGVDAELLYNERLQRAMDHCRVFLFVSSKNSRSKFCDAYSLEMQYIREQDAQKSADPNYYYGNYKLLLEKDRRRCKPRVEYLIEGYGDTVYEAQVKEFFSGLTWCTDKEGVYSALKKILTAAPNVSSQITRNFPTQPQKVDTNEDPKIREYRKKAEQGDAVAQNNLGVCYKKGEGVTQDYEKAVYWYTKSAEQGNVIAQCNLGYCYEFGQGVRRDYCKAVYWYKESAKHGDADAQKCLGVCYEYGRGVTKNYVKAVYWYTKSAKQGYAEAQKCLGICYECGRGVIKNYVKAVYWYRKSAEQGDAVAQCNLGVCYKNGQGVMRDYRKAFYWYTKSAEQGDAVAQCNLGNSYYDGKGVTYDYGKAVYWYTKSAEQGYANAQKCLALCYEFGQGVTKDYGEAVYWYRKAARQGDQDAKNKLRQGKFINYT